MQGTCESVFPTASEPPQFSDKQIYPEITRLQEVIEQYFQLGKINEDNLESLEAIQKVILIEEGQNVNINDVLARVLQFYRLFVPYK